MVTFGVLGAGIIGQLRAQTVAGHPGTALGSVCDTDAAAAQRAAAGTGARVETDWRRVVSAPEVDAVIVSTPVQLHEEMCIAALEAGKHVLCEKPLAASVDGCRRIVDAARRCARALAVGFNHRFYPAMQFVKRVVDEGRIGTLDHLRVFGGHDGLSNFRSAWMYQGALSGGGAMMDVGIHMTDLTRFIAGEIKDVYAVASGRVWGVEGSEDNAVAIFRTTSGLPVRYHATWNEWRGYRIAVEAYGDRGMVLGSYAPMFNLLITQDRPGARRRRTFRLYPDIILREKLQGWQTTTRRTFERELADFLAMTDGRTVDLADGHAGLRAVEIAQAVYRSQASGGVVTV
jgi:predicted dehydrogenase